MVQWDPDWKRSSPAMQTLYAILKCHICCMQGVWFTWSRLTWHQTSIRWIFVLGNKSTSTTFALFQKFSPCNEPYRKNVINGGHQTQNFPDYKLPEDLRTSWNSLAGLKSPSHSAYTAQSLLELSKPTPMHEWPEHSSQNEFLTWDKKWRVLLLFHDSAIFHSLPIFRWTLGGKCGQDKWRLPNLVAWFLSLWQQQWQTKS